MIPVELDEFLVEPVPIVFELGLQGHDFGLDLLHLLHGLIALVLQRHEQSLNPEGEENDGGPVVMRKVMQEPQYGKERLGHGFDETPTSVDEPPEIDRVLESQIHRLQHVVFLRAGVEAERERGAGRRGRVPGRGGHDLIQFLFDDHRRGARGNQHAHEVLVLQRQPTHVA